MCYIICMYYLCTIYLSIYQSIYLSIYLSISLSIFFYFILFYYHLSKEFRKVFCRGISKDTIEGNCRGIEQICSCGQEIEISTYFLLPCSNYHCARQILFEKVKKIDSSILNQNDQVITKLLLFGDEN